MLSFDRDTEPAPACLSDSRTAEARLALRDIFLTEESLSAQTRFSMAQYALRDPELDESLRRLFRNRCAFCESPTRARAYRFRPTEEAGPAESAPRGDAHRGHLYYTWLANSWQNIYSICKRCEPLEASVFPVIGRRCALPTAKEVEAYARYPAGTWAGKLNERPLLLDPCGSEDFRKHLAALPDGGLVALTDRGSFTISHFHLQREDLIHSRRQAFEANLAKLMTTDDFRFTFASLFAFEDMPYGGGWFLLLYQIARKLGGGGGQRPTLSQHRIAGYYARRRHQPEFADRVRRIVTDLIANPEQIIRQGSPPPTPYASEGLRPRSFHIRHFKALEELKVDIPGQTDAVSMEDRQSLAPALVILGENAAGKSSILEAMALGLCSQGVRDDLTPDTQHFILDPAFMGNTQRSAPQQASVEVTYEEGRTRTLDIDVGGMSERNGDPVPTLPVFAYGAFRLFLKADKKDRPSSVIRSLFEPNYVLPNPEKWLASLKGTPTLSEVARALKYVLAIDQDVDVIEVGETGKDCYLVTRTARPGADPITVKTPFISVSSGFRAVLGMACDIMSGLLDAQGATSASLAKARAVVLIDEVEAHLHPRWKMRILQGLREALPNVTFIVTTHDPLCLRGLSSGEVMVLRRSLRPGAGDDDLPEYVEQLDELPAIGTLTIEQLLTSDLFQLFSTDAPDTERALARFGDALARQASGGISPDDTQLQDARAAIKAQITRALPVGSTEVERIVQEAVELHLAERRTKRPSEISELNAKTRERIIAALEGL
ncbi:AAA family ATPase [Aquabacter cavernae]|uniref:AAA family ATPase n=1 Tax=Aquabacter cavernae TaxID=2496029 RepID=UPI000F8D1503|nr:AAA family ATPase [Aquabacter cavernae]